MSTFCTDHVGGIKYVGKSQSCMVFFSGAFAGIVKPTKPTPRQPVRVNPAMKATAKVGRRAGLTSSAELLNNAESVAFAQAGGEPVLDGGWRSFRSQLQRRCPRPLSPDCVPTEASGGQATSAGNLTSDADLRMLASRIAAARISAPPAIPTSRSS